MAKYENLVKVLGKSQNNSFGRCVHWYNHFGQLLSNIWLMDLKTHIPYHSAIQFLGIYPRETEICSPVHYHCISISGKSRNSVHVNMQTG